jgi:hypothetical protein
MGNSAEFPIRFFFGADAAKDAKQEPGISAGPEAAEKRFCPLPQVGRKGPASGAVFDEAVHNAGQMLFQSGGGGLQVPGPDGAEELLVP